MRQVNPVCMNNRKLWLLGAAMLLCSCAAVFIHGCAVVDFAKPEKEPSNEQIIQGYLEIKPGKSNSADVLRTIHIPEHELLSQSKSVVASSAQSKEGYKMWFNMAAFDENSSVVQRKYLFIEDEKPKSLFVEPWGYAKFDCKIILSKEVLEKPYSNENARRIAILTEVLEKFRADIDQVSADNKVFETTSMIVNQAIEAALTKLDSSPAEAARFDKNPGIEFSIFSYDKGRIRMLLEADIAIIEIKLGSITKKGVGNTIESLEDMQEQE